jgi:hypothetical protein
MPKALGVSVIRLQRPLKVPPVPAFTALKEILSGIESQDGAWSGFALHVALGDLHLPDVGYVAVPVALMTGETHADARSIDLQFTSANNAASFPRFTGVAGIDTTGPTGSILWLAGDYDVPLHVVGRLFDKTLASGVAERALENLIEDLAVALVANVEKREAQYARYRLY